MIEQVDSAEPCCACKHPLRPVRWVIRMDRLVLRLCCLHALMLRYTMEGEVLT